MLGAKRIPGTARLAPPGEHRGYYTFVDEGLSSLSPLTVLPEVVPAVHLTHQARKPRMSLVTLSLSRESLEHSHDYFSLEGPQGLVCLGLRHKRWACLREVENS